MNDNLVGYLLNALDPDAHREVETYLHDNPEAQRHLDLLRQALEPLAADKDDIEPPPAGLTLRTLAAVAEYRCRPLPQAPSPPPRILSVAPQRRRWRFRPDVLVAAGLLIAVGGVGLAWLDDARYKGRKHECARNLHDFHNALVKYSEDNGGNFPNVAGQQPPRNVAGIFVPLIDKGEPNSARVFNVRCPAGNKPPPLRRTWEEIQSLPDDEFINHVAPELAGCYAYSLGYRDNEGNYCGLRQGDNDRLPIMADRPPRAGLGNSANHRGRGQNVLRLGGSVEFREEPTAGLDGDHIYINRNGKVAAGLDAEDTVLGASPDRPQGEK